jgi:hypothetical protein
MKYVKRSRLLSKDCILLADYFDRAPVSAYVLCNIIVIYTYGRVVNTVIRQVI